MLHQKEQNFNQSAQSKLRKNFDVKQLKKIQNDASAFKDIEIGGFLQ